MGWPKKVSSRFRNRVLNPKDGVERAEPWRIENPPRDALQSVLIDFGFRRTEMLAKRQHPTLLVPVIVRYMISKESGSTETVTDRGRGVTVL